MKLILNFLFLFLLVCFKSYAIDIVPLPYIVIPNGKTFCIPSNIDLKSLLSDNNFTEIKAFHSGIRNKDANFDALCMKLGFFKKDLGDEGYELWIDNKQIVLAANSERGIFYGKQSLKQLIRSSSENKISGLHIIDKPAFKYRGLLDDISRGSVPTKEYMKYQIRRISELKMNMLSYYAEHVVLTEKHPEFAPPKGGISIKEWKEIAEYAKNHFVELVPDFQSLGHAAKVLESPKYRYLGESSSMFSPVNPKTISFMKDIYDEMCPSFTSGFFNIDGDEAFDLGRGESKKLADSIGIAGVYVQYVNQLADILRNHNKRMIICSDMALKYPKILDNLTDDAVIFSWNYDDNKSFSKWIDPFINKGFDYLICPGVLNSHRLFPDYDSAIPNIHNFVKEGVGKGALGIINCVWDDGGVESFDRDWYGVAYGAEQSWNPNDNNIIDFDSRLSNGIYQSEGMPLFSAIHKLTEMGKIPALKGMNQQFFWKRIIPERGQYVSYNISGWEDVYASCVEIDSILPPITSNSSYYYKLEYAAIKFVIDEYKYLALAKLNMFKASEQYSQACINQFSNREEAALLLKEVRKKIVLCKKLFDQLKDNYKTIWQCENRDYWFNYAMDPYVSVQRRYADLLTSFDYSVSCFNENLPLCVPVDIRLDIRATSGSYFNYWLISPAFKLNDKLDFEFDFLKGMGGEKKASPFPGFSFTDSSGNNVKWIKFSSPLSDRVPLNDVLNGDNNSITYAFCTLESPDNRNVTAFLGVNKSIEVFCNGESVFLKKDNNKLVIDEFPVSLKLKPGKNRILLKIEKGNSDWTFSFSIKDGIVNSRKNKYRIQ